MNRKTVLALIALCFGFASSSSAENNGWGVFGSYWNSADGEAVTGPGLRITAELFPEAMLDFRVSSFSGLVEHPDGDLDVVPLDLGVTVLFPMNEIFTLHLGAGFGYYLADGPGADDEFGLNVLGGGEVLLKKSDASYGRVDIKLFAELMYRAVDLKNTAGANVDGAGLNAGLMVNW